MIHHQCNWNSKMSQKKIKGLIHVPHPLGLGQHKKILTFTLLTVRINYFNLVSFTIILYDLILYADKPRWGWVVITIFIALWLLGGFIYLQYKCMRQNKVLHALEDMQAPKESTVTTEE